MSFQLTKDEIPVFGTGGFYVPIHPILLDPSKRFDHELANSLFASTVEEWRKDLRFMGERGQDLGPQATELYRDGLLDEGRLKVVKTQRQQELDITGWNDIVKTDERGFATTLALSPGMNSIYFSKTDRNCELSLSLDGERSKRINLSSDKVRALSHESHGGYGSLRVYGHHNMANHGSAIFLRNWALNYVNAAMKSLGL